MLHPTLDEIRALLDFAETKVRPGGTAAIISFHSLEDRLVKRAFQDRQTWERITKKPMLPSDEERAVNPRSRSAKLRVARRWTRRCSANRFCLWDP